MTGRVDEAPASHAAVPQPAEPAGPPRDVDKLSSVLLELEALRLNFARLADQLTELVKSGHEHEAKWVDELRRLWSELEQVQKRQLQFELSMLSTGVGALRGNLDRVRAPQASTPQPEEAPGEDGLDAEAPTKTGSASDESLTAPAAPDDEDALAQRFREGIRRPPDQ